MSLSDSLIEHLNRKKDYYNLQVVFEAIKLGLEPWDPGEMIAYRTDINRYGFTITFKTRLLPNLPFTANIDAMRYIDIPYLVAEVAERAFLFYRNRPRVEPEDHIILGEE